MPCHRFFFFSPEREIFTASFAARNELWRIQEIAAAAPNAQEGSRDARSALTQMTYYFALTATFYCKIKKINCPRCVFFFSENAILSIFTYYFYIHEVVLYFFITNKKKSNSLNVSYSNLHNFSKFFYFLVAFILHAPHFDIVIIIKGIVLYGIKRIKWNCRALLTNDIIIASLGDAIKTRPIKRERERVTL